MLPCFPEHFKIKLPVNMVKPWLFQGKQMHDIFINISPLHHSHPGDKVSCKFLLPDQLYVIHDPVINSISTRLVCHIPFPIYRYQDRMKLLQIMRFSLLRRRPFVWITNLAGIESIICSNVSIRRRGSPPKNSSIGVSSREMNFLRSSIEYRISLGSESLPPWQYSHLRLHSLVRIIWYCMDILYCEIVEPIPKKQLSRKHIGDKHNDKMY